MPPADVRRAVAADLAAVLAMYRELSPEGPHISLEQAGPIWSRMLAVEGLTIFVAEADGHAASTCKLIVTPNLTRAGRPFALIENVVTASAYRKRGLGQAVLRHAIDAAWGASCYKVMLMTGRTDPAIHRFYEEVGFQRGKTAFQIRRPV